MNSNKPYTGVVIPLTTPFTEDGKIDQAATERIVKRIARHNLGVFVLGTTGETASIPRPSRFHIVESVVRAADGKIPVYAGIGDNCLENSVLASDHYRDLGVTAVVAHLPSYYPLTTDEMEAYFRLLLSKVSGPLMIYNIPATTQMSVPVEIVERLADLPYCVGFKDSENSPGRMKAVYQALGGRANFALFMGSAVLSYASLKMGYDGLVPSSGNLIPHLWEELYNTALAGDWDKAAQTQDELDEISVVFQKDRTLGQSLAVLKAAMSAIGLCEPTVLPPLHTLDIQERERVRDQIFTLCPYLKNEVEALHSNRG